MRRKREIVLYSLLLVYILFLMYLAVFRREPANKSIVWLDLLGGYLHPRYNSISNGLLNLFSFIPIGVLVSLIAGRYKIGKSMLVGLLVSGVIELSQLISRRGVFDVDDFLNDVVGAFIGGLLVVLVMRIREKASARESIS